MQLPPAKLSLGMELLRNAVFTMMSKSFRITYDLMIRLFCEKP